MAAQQEVTNALNSGAINVKFKAPNTPLEAEQSEQFLVPTPTYFNKEISEWTRWYKHVNPEIATIEAQESHELAKKEINRKFAYEFQKWLQGKSYWNIQKQPDGSTDCTPWQTKPLVNLPGVQEYLRQFPQKRAEFILALVELYMRGPRDLQEAYIYYKYLVVTNTLSPIEALSDEIGFLDEYAILFPNSQAAQYLTAPYFRPLPHKMVVNPRPDQYPTNEMFATDQLLDLNRSLQERAEQIEKNDIEHRISQLYIPKEWGEWTFPRNQLKDYRTGIAASIYMKGQLMGVPTEVSSKLYNDFLPYLAEQQRYLVNRGKGITPEDISDDFFNDNGGGDDDDDDDDPYPEISGFLPVTKEERKKVEEIMDMELDADWDGLMDFFKQNSDPPKDVDDFMNDNGGGGDDDDDNPPDDTPTGFLPVQNQPEPMQEDERASNERQLLELEREIRQLRQYQEDLQNIQEDPYGWYNLRRAIDQGRYGDLNMKQFNIPPDNPQPPTPGGDPLNPLPRAHELQLVKNYQEYTQGVVGRQQQLVADYIHRGEERRGYYTTVIDDIDKTRRKAKPVEKSKKDPVEIAKKLEFIEEKLPAIDAKAIKQVVIKENPELSTQPPQEAIDYAAAFRQQLEKDLAQQQQQPQQQYAPDPNFKPLTPEEVEKLKKKPLPLIGAVSDINRPPPPPPGAGAVAITEPAPTSKIAFADEGVDVQIVTPTKAPVFAPNPALINLAQAAQSEEPKRQQTAFVDAARAEAKAKREEARLAAEAQQTTPPQQDKPKKTQEQKEARRIVKQRKKELVQWEEPEVATPTPTPTPKTETLAEQKAKLTPGEEHRIVDLAMKPENEKYALSEIVKHVLAKGRMEEIYQPGLTMFLDALNARRREQADMRAREALDQYNRMEAEVNVAPDSITKLYRLARLKMSHPSSALRYNAQDAESFLQRNIPAVVTDEQINEFMQLNGGIAPGWLQERLRRDIVPPPPEEPKEMTGIEHEDVTMAEPKQKKTEPMEEVVNAAEDALMVEAAPPKLRIIITEQDLTQEQVEEIQVGFTTLPMIQHISDLAHGRQSSLITLEGEFERKKAKLLEKEEKKKKKNELPPYMDKNPPRPGDDEEEAMVQPPSPDSPAERALVVADRKRGPPSSSSSNKKQKKRSDTPNQNLNPIQKVEQGKKIHGQQQQIASKNKVTRLQGELEQSYLDEALDRKKKGRSSQEIRTELQQADKRHQSILGANRIKLAAQAQDDQIARSKKLQEQIVDLRMKMSDRIVELGNQDLQELRSAIESGDETKIQKAEQKLTDLSKVYQESPLKLDVPAQDLGRITALYVNVARLFLQTMEARARLERNPGADPTARQRNDVLLKDSLQYLVTVQNLRHDLLERVHPTIHEQMSIINQDIYQRLSATSDKLFGTDIMNLAKREWARMVESEAGQSAPAPPPQVSQVNPNRPGPKKISEEPEKQQSVNERLQRLRMQGYIDDRTAAYLRERALECFYGQVTEDSALNAIIARQDDVFLDFLAAKEQRSDRKIRENIGNLERFQYEAPPVQKYDFSEDANPNRTKQLMDAENIIDAPYQKGRKLLDKDFPIDHKHNMALYFMMLSKKDKIAAQKAITRLNVLADSDDIPRFDPSNFYGLARLVESDKTSWEFLARDLFEYADNDVSLNVPKFNTRMFVLKNIAILMKTGDPVQQAAAYNYLHSLMQHKYNNLEHIDTRVFVPKDYLRNRHQYR